MYRHSTPIRVLVWLAIMSATLLSFARGQAPDATAPVADVHFRNGDKLRMSLLASHLNVNTSFGKLKVPWRSVVKIEFGLHVVAGDQERINLAARKLSSDVYKEREVGNSEFLRLGYLALPALRRIQKDNPDGEASLRAAGLVRSIGDLAPAALLNLPDYDEIRTSEFTIRGKIAEEALAVHSVHFGNVSLSLSGLQTVTGRSALVSQEFVLDASKVGSSLDTWFDTGLLLSAKQRLVVTAEGQVDLWPQGPGQYMAAPKGYNTVGKGGQFLAGALIGKIGNTGKAFFLGDRLDNVFESEGNLYLQITPSPWNNVSAGSYAVKVRLAE